MRVYLCLPLLLLACGEEPAAPAQSVTTPVTPGVPGPVPNVESKCGTLSLRTWNVENFPQWSGAGAELAEIIRAHPADVIGLQEIDEPDAFWALDDLLPEYEGVLAESGYYTGVALLYRPDKVDLKSARSLFTDDSYAFPRPPLDTTFEVLASGETLHVVVLHLKARGDAESRARRRAAVEQLSDWAERTGLDQAPLVIMGDLNDELTDADEYNSFSLLLDDPDYRFLTLPIEEANGFTYLGWASMLDHILVSQATLNAWTEITTEVVRLDQSWSDYERDVSDHLPVDAEFLVGH